MQPTIAIRNLAKRYRDCEALDGVSLQVPPGVVFALLGEVLSQDRKGRQLQMMVLGFTDADREAIASSAGVVAIELKHPTLEEIFVACTHGTPPERVATEAEAVRFGQAV